MKVETKNNGIVLSDVTSGVTVETKDGKELKIRERDGGFDVKFGKGKWLRIDEETDIVVNVPKYVSKSIAFFG